MVAKRGQFTASVKIHIDDSSLDKEAQELVKKLGKVTDALDIPVGIDYKKGDLEVFQNFMKDIKNADTSKFSTTVIRNSMEKLGVSVVKSKDDLEMFKSVYQSFISLLKDGQTINVDNLVGMASGQQVEYYNKLIEKQETYIAKQKELIKINENLEKAAAKKYKEAHQQYMDTPTDKKREFNAARKKFVSAGLYYQSVAQDKYGEGAAEMFSYNLDGDTYEPGDDFLEAKKSLELTDKKIKQLVNSVKKEIKDSSATLNEIIGQAENKLNELKNTRDVLEKQAIAKVTTTPSQKASSAKKNIAKDEVKQDDNAKQDKQKVTSQKKVNEAKKEEQVIEQDIAANDKKSVQNINDKVAAQEKLNNTKKEEKAIEQEIVSLENTSLENKDKEIQKQESSNKSKKGKKQDFYIFGTDEVGTGTRYAKNKVSGYVDEKRQLGLYKNIETNSWDAIDLATGLTEFTADTKKELKQIIDKNWQKVVDRRNKDTYQKDVDDFKALPASDETVEVKVDNDKTSTAEAAKKIEQAIETQSTPEIPVKVDDATVVKEADVLKDKIEDAAKQEALQKYKTPEQRAAENDKKGNQARYARINKLLNDYYSELNDGGDATKLKGIEKELSEKLRAQTETSARTMAELLKKNLPSGKDATIQAVDKKFGTNIAESISKIKPVIKPEIDEAKTSIVAEQVETKIETEAKPVIEPKVDSTKLQEETKKATEDASKQAGKATDATTAKKSTWGGLDNKTKGLITYIGKQVNTKYGKQTWEEIYNQIALLLKSSVDSGTPLDDTQLADLVAMNRAYKKKTGNKSPNAHILKHRLGITDFDKVYGGKYGDLKDLYETIQQESQLAKKQREMKNIAATQEDSGLKETKQDLQEIKVAADTAADSIKNVETAAKTTDTSKELDPIEEKLRIQKEYINDLNELAKFHNKYRNELDKQLDETMLPMKSEYTKMIKDDSYSVEGAKHDLWVDYNRNNLINMKDDVDYRKVSTEAGNISTTFKAVRQCISEVDKYSKSGDVDQDKLIHLINKLRQYIHFCYDSDKMLEEARGKLNGNVFNELINDKYNEDYKEELSNQFDIRAQAILDKYKKYDWFKEESVLEDIWTAQGGRYVNKDIFSIDEDAFRKYWREQAEKEKSKTTSTTQEPVEEQKIESATESVKELTTSLENAGNEAVETGNSIKNAMDESQQEIKDTSTSVKELNQNLDEIAAKSGKDKKYSLSADKLRTKETRYENVTDRVNKSKLIGDFAVDKVDGEVVTLSQHVENLHTKIKQALNELKQGNFDSEEALSNKIKEYDNLVKALENISKNPTYQQFVKGKGSKLGDILGGIDQSDISSKLQDLLKGKFKGIKDFSYNEETNQAVAHVFDSDKIKKVTLSLEEYQNELKETVTQVRMLSGAEKENLSSGQKWIAGLKSKLSNLTQYVTGIELVMRAWNMAKEGFNFVKELNTSMTTIYQTMDITTQGLDKLSKKAIQASKALGAASEQMLDSVNIYAAYGKTVDEIINQAQPTVMLANAAQSSAEEASNQIQAVVQQYTELEGQEARIVNAYEKIAANVQIDFDKGIQSIAEGVQVAGTVANESGLSFEQFAASVAKVAERTRMEGSSIGNAYKTIMARVSRSKTGDEEASIEERGDAAKALSKIGINVYDESGAYQDFSVTLDMLAEKWDTLTDAQKANISEAMSGVRNINTMNALIGTWTEAQQLANDAVEDSTYYLEVQDKWMDSMQAKLNTLTATIQEFWYNFYDVGSVNLMIDGLTTVVRVAEGVVNVFKGMGSVFGDKGGQVGAIAGAAATVFTVASAWTSFNKKLTTPDENGGFSTHRNGFIGMFKDLGELFKKGKTTVKDYWETFAWGTVQATNGMTGIKGGLSEVISKLGVFKTSVIGIGAALVALGVGIKIFDALTTSTEEAAEAAKKASDEYKQAQQTLKNNKEIINSVSKDYKNLSEGVDLNTNENISLTNDEYAKYIDICNQIADIYPSLVQSYDEQGNAILRLKGNVALLNEEYEKERLNAARTNASNLDEYETDFMNKTGNRSYWTYLADAWNDFGTPDVGGTYTEGDALGILNKINEMSYEKFKDYFKNNRDMTELSYLLSDDVLDIGFWDNWGNATKITEDQFKEMKTKIPSLIAEYTSVINDSANQVKSSMQSLILKMQLDPETYSDFKGVDSSVFEHASAMISNMTYQQIEALKQSGKSLSEYTYNLVEGIKNSEKAQVSLSNIFDLKSEDADLEEIKKVIENDLVTLAKELEISKDDLPQLKVQLGLDDEFELVEQYNKTVNTVSKKVQKQQKNITKETGKANKKAKNLVDEYDELEYYSKKVKDYIKEQGINTASELTLLQNCVDTTDSWAEAMRKFELTNIADYEEIIENLKGNLTTVATNIENVNEAVTAANGSIGLSEEQIKNVVSAFEDLDGFDYDMLFESTASGVRLNAYELQKLNAEYEKTQKLKYEETLNDMGEKYEDLCVAITETEDAQEKLDLIARRNTLKDQIKEVQELASRYGGLTSAYTKWQNAQDTTNSHEMYDNIYSGLEEIDELYQRDLTGTDDFKTYMQQFFYGDLDEYLNKAGMSYEQFYKSKAAEIQKYFTKDNTGSVNFLNKLKEEGFATNENGQWLIDGDIEEIAERFKWATSSIDAQFKKLEAHEFKFRFVEKDPLEDLKVAAQEASSVITETFGDEYEFNFNTDNIDVVDGYINQLQSLKAQGGLTEEQIAALNKQVDYWTARKGDLTKAVEIDFDLNKSIAELEICADILEKLGKEVNINLNPSNASEARTEIEKAWTLLQGLLKEDGTLDLEVEGAEEALTILGNLIYSRKTLEDTAIIMDVDTSMIEGNMSSAIEKVKEYRLAVQELETINELNTEYNLNLDTSEVQKQVDAALTAVKGIDKDILTSLKLDTTSEEKLKESISAIDAQLLVEAGVNEEAIIGYKPENKTAEVVYDYSKTDAYNRFLNSNLDRSATVTYKYNTEGTPPSTAAKTYNNPFGLANGTAHANGNTLLQRGLAFAKGTWGAAKGGMSLVGELGRELVVRGNRFFTVGDNGAEFTDIKKGDIVFNHKQTESLLENGYVTGRGHMVGDSYAEGNAYALVSALGLGGSPGRYTNNGYEPTNPSLNNTPTDNESQLKKTNEAAEEFLETLDWVEIMIDRLERKIQDLDTIANSAYKNFTKRNNTLAEEFGKVTDEIELQQKAYDVYIAKANSINLSETYKQKVRDGKLQIEDITNEDLKEKIDEYQEWLISSHNTW